MCMGSELYPFNWKRTYSRILIPSLFLSLPFYLYSYAFRCGYSTPVGKTSSNFYNGYGIMVRSTGDSFSQAGRSARRSLNSPHSYEACKAAVHFGSLPDQSFS